MKHPDGTSMTPAEWTAERVRRWEWLGKQQRSAYPVSHLSLPLFQRYAEGELGNLAELIEEMHRHFNKRRFPEGPDGPELFRPPPPLPQDEDAPVVERGAVPAPYWVTPPPQAREAYQKHELGWLIERGWEQTPDDPLIGQWVRFTASPYVDDDEEGRTLN